MNASATVLRGVTPRRLRLYSGLVLFAFIATHFLNHALGLVSLQAMEAGLAVFKAVWVSWPGLTLLYGSVAVHVGLVLVALYLRRSLRLRPWEWLQALLGIAVVPLAVYHVVGTRLAESLYGVDASYVYVLLAHWYFDPGQVLQQLALIAVVWLHGCLGLHYYFRLRSWYPAVQTYAFAAAILLPVLAVLGYVQGGRDVLELAGSESWLAAALAEIGVPPADAVGHLVALGDGIKAGLGGALLLVVAGRFARPVWERRHGVFTVSYPGDREVRAPFGPTLLEISRMNGIPHASVCGGRGRCSTCRVRVQAGFEELDPPREEEARVLERIGAGEHIRLACQLRPRADLTVTPLLPPTASARDGQYRPRYLQGEEREIAILFADIRGFTAFSERKLPYDVVFILNRYFREMGEAIEDAGGRLDKFIGDGVMALFGMQDGAAQGCRQALAAARGMGERLDLLNRSLADELPDPLRIGIGIHVGPAIVGELGYSHAIGVTAIGDAVNTASRLEAATKEYDCQLVVSEDVLRHAGLAPEDGELHEMSVRGRRQKLRIRSFATARELPDFETVAARMRAAS
jgi:adenylate cyclase